MVEEQDPLHQVGAVRCPAMTDVCAVALSKRSRDWGLEIPWLNRWTDSKGKQESTGVKCEISILIHNSSPVREEGKPIWTALTCAVERARREEISCTK